MVPATGKPCVLLVDDVEANLVALSAELDRLGCELVRANNGNEALRQLLKREFAVMLLDVQMPDMDGFEVAHHARENPQTRDVPIIFVTAMHETEAGVLRGYGSGAVDILFKPVNPYILRSKVQVFLDLYLSRRRLADEIEAHKRTLVELEGFSYSVSHDLRAPLRPLVGFAQALLEDYGDKLDAQGKEYLVRIRAAGQRMGQLIEDLLRLARIGRSELRRESVNLTALAEAVFAELRSAEPDRPCELVAAPDLKVKGDEGLLRVALENLLRNAWKFSRKKPQVRIELGTRSARGQAAYFVRDGGVGFRAESASRMFQPFQRFHSGADFEGTGIGLAIVDRIVRHHGGEIWAESVPGEGATFLFTLP